MTLLLPLLALAGQDFRLESLNLDYVRQGWGSPQRGKSVDGHPLTIGGRTFQHGLGTHAMGEILVNLHGDAERFVADVGLDAETGERGSVQFEVLVDGRTVAQSPIMRPGQAPYHVNVPLAKAKKLILLCTDAGDGMDYDHGDWADAVISVRAGGKAPTIVGYPVEPPMPIATAISPRPEIHGPRRVGCTPGNPFLFKIPATGNGPLRYAVDKLPSGLNLDPATGLLSGRVANAGSYTVQVTVKGARGVAKRKLEIVAGDHKLALTPPMGWNSWNVWGTSVTADRVKAAADSFLKSGLIDYGYHTINIDDAWEGARDQNGEIVTNPKFGDMRSLADYVHARGMTLGIYSSPGPKTCANYEGSYQHEEQDAKTYGSWGIDYLKYDWCSYGNIKPNPTLDELKEPYIKMRNALDASGRDIVFSLCQYGMGDVFKWGKSIGGNLWRTTGDINDSYDSMANIAFAHSEKAMGVGPGGWNDPDMLVVGRLGWGDNPRPTRLSGNEQIMHITMWSLLAAPLILGCDLTKLDPWTKALITNPDVLDVDQDPLGKAATRVWARDGVEVWARNLYDGTLAVGVMNRTRQTATTTVRLHDLGVTKAAPVRDLWLRRALGVKSDLRIQVPSHGAKLYRIGKIAED